ncbi:hypothetical protein MRX96_057185 [Rhipicephalus microplus]
MRTDPPHQQLHSTSSSTTVSCTGSFISCRPTWCVTTVTCSASSSTCCLICYATTVTSSGTPTSCHPTLSSTRCGKLIRLVQQLPLEVVREHADLSGCIEQMDVCPRLELRVQFPWQRSFLHRKRTMPSYQTTHTSAGGV